MGEEGWTRADRRALTSVKARHLNDPGRPRPEGLRASRRW